MHKHLLSKKDQVQKIKNGKGIQHILDEAYKILSNPMLIHDMEYKLIAFSNGAVTDDPIWNEYIEHNRLSDETIEFCKNESFIDDVANCTNREGVTYLISDKLKYDRIFGQLHNKHHMTVAGLCAVACENPFGDDVPGVIKAICNVLSKELLRSEFYQDYGLMYQESIIKTLIDGSIQDKRIYTAHIANVDKNLKNNIFVAVADIAKHDPTYTKLVYFRDLFAQEQPAFKYAIYSHYIVILMSSDQAELYVKKDLHRLCSLFEQNDIYIGISSNFDNLFELRTYYTEAVGALHDGLKQNERIFFYKQT